MPRDVVAEIIAYNRPGSGPPAQTAEALRRKLLALASTPFQFFRGTFHLMADDLFKSRVSLAQGAAPEGLIVGDLHLENFGVYRGQSGALVFDVNDFDDVGFGPIDLDLRRLCTSALLLPDVAPKVRLEVAVAVAQAWLQDLRKIGGRFPVPAWTEDKAEGPVAGLLQQSGRRTQEDLISKAAPDGERIADSPKFAHVDQHWWDLAREAFSEYVEHLKALRAPDAPKGWDVLDVAYRFKGTGSLGRMRFTLLLGQDRSRRLVELKEARPSAMDLARGRSPDRERARVQTAAIRRLQGDPWPRVAATRLGETSALARENEPEERKIDGDWLADATDLQLYGQQCGQVLARLHARMNAPALLGADWRPEDAARTAVEFAERYAVQVEADQRTFMRSKDDAARALGID